MRHNWRFTCAATGAQAKKNMLRETIEHHRQGRLEEAEKGYREELAANPDSGEALRGLSAVRRLRGDLAESAELIRRAHELAPEQPKLLLMLGSIELESGNIEASRDAYERALAIDPNLAGAHTALGHIAMMKGDAKLAEQYFRNPQSNLAIIRCAPWTHKDKVALVGDSAHAIVPFYGEGMNSGYEDCKVLNDLLNEHGDDDWGTVLDAYGKARKPNGDAIADLSLRNFVEMRDLVADPRFILRKKIEGRLQQRHPDKWLPLYSQVKFSDIPYVDAWNEGLRHDRIMEEVLAMPGIEERWDSEEVERKALELLGTA